MNHLYRATPRKLNNSDIRDIHFSRHWSELRFGAALTCLTLGCLLLASVTAAAAGRLSPAESGFSIIDADAHRRTWERIVLVTNANQQVSLRTNRFTEVSTGLMRRIGAQWVPSTPMLVITNTGVFGIGAQHIAYFGADINRRAATQIRFATGTWLKSHILGLVYQDTASLTNVLIGRLRDSTAEVSENCVVYPDAFTGAFPLAADVIYQYTAQGVSQDILLRSRPPAPELFGLHSGSTHLAVVTELVETEVPRVSGRVMPAGPERMVDETIEIGPMRMAPGMAFYLNGSQSPAFHQVAKQYESTVDGRQLVVERIRYDQIQAELMMLPGPETVSTNSGATAASAGAGPAAAFKNLAALPAPPETSAPGSAPVKKLAQARPRNGFLLDWLMVEDNALTFLCGETYLVVGESHLSSATFQAGTVVKYDLGASLWVDGQAAYEDPCAWGTPPILTSVNDDWTGEVISGWSNGEPLPGEYGPALVVQAEYVPAVENFIINYSSTPAIATNIPTVKITASDPVAVKGLTNNGTFTFTRVNGDWSQPLTISFSVSGTAAEGTDYSSIARQVTIAQGCGTNTLTITPGTASGTTFDACVTLTISNGPAYNINPPASASIHIFDPTTPAPPPVGAPADLVGWWRGETNANDSAGSNHGERSGGVGYSFGSVGQAFEFDGIDDRVSVPSAACLNFSTNEDFSIEAWILPLATNTSYGVQAVVDKRNTPNSSSAVGYTLFLLDGKVAFQMADAPLAAGRYSNFGPPPSTSDLRDGAFHHVVVTVDRDATNGLKFYVDGVMQGSGYNPGLEPGDLSNTEPLRIGNHAATNLNANFKGTIDEASLYRRALSSDDVYALYGAGRGGKTIVPYIVTQPASQTRTQWQTAQFTVTAVGAAPLGYQWNFNGTPISGATGSALSKANVQPSDAGTYSVVVSNFAGTAASSGATLTVLVPPSISSHPTNQTVVGGQSVTLTVAAAGTSPLYYQWYRDSIPMAGATAAQLAISNASFWSGGTYRVSVTNVAGSATSSNAEVAVCVPSPAPGQSIAWWPGEGNANDLLGTHHGALYGGATATNGGKVGQCFAFDGTNGYVQIPHSSALCPTNLTVEAWVLFNSLTSFGSTGDPYQQYIVFKKNTLQSSFEGFYLGKERLNGGDGFVFGVSSSAGTFVGVESVPLIGTGVWYHVAGVRGSNYIQLYVNGELAGQATVNSPQDYGTRPLFFGSSGESWDRKLYGKLDEVGLYGRALTPAEIRRIYQASVAGKAAFSVALHSPASGSTLTVPADPVLIASAFTATGQIGKVEFFANGMKLGGTAAGTNGFYSFTWTNPPTGPSALTAVASNTFGASITSAVANVSVISGSFARGVNLNGPAVVIEGQPWSSYGDALAAGLTVSNATPAALTNSFTLLPLADDPTAAMLQTMILKRRLPTVQEQQAANVHCGYIHNGYDRRFFFTNLPSGCVVRTNVEYRGWCVQYNTDDSLTNFPCSLYYSYGDRGARFGSNNWNKVNYILNHKGSATLEDVQRAIWTVLGTSGVATGTEEYKRLTNEAGLYGQTFVPAENEIAGVLFENLTNSTKQPFIVELESASAKAVGFTLTQTNLADGAYYASFWLLECQTNATRSLSIKMQDRLVATRIGSDLEPGQWSKYGAYSAEVTNGTLKIEVSSPVQGDPMLMGLALYRVQSTGSVSVTIRAPGSNTVFVAPAAIPISAEVSPANAVRYVQFLTNAAQGEIGRDLLSRTNPYQFTWAGVPAGEYMLYARAANEAGGAGLSAPVPVRVVPKVSVEAGADRVLVLTNAAVAAVLSGSISGGDGAVTSLWEMVTGPVLAGLTNATSTNAVAAFTNAGNYQLRLSAGDGHSWDSSVITVSVVSNQPPVVDAGPNLILHTTNAAVVLRGSARDDGLPAAPLQLQWAVAEPAGCGLSFTNEHTAVTVVSGFPSNGVYRLRLSAFDGLVTSHREMTVTVAPAGSRTWTWNADFAEGTLVNLNFEETADQLQLNRTVTPLPFVWVACSARGTVVRIDAQTGRVMGEYRTAPVGVGSGSPSRTTVDKYGNAWVANRNDNYTNGTGSVARFGLVIGGTRGRLEYTTNGVITTNFVADANGQYLRPPFQYCTAVDRDGDGLIRTSRGLGDYLGWGGEADLAGGVSEAEDECILNYTRVAAQGVRTIAVDANNDVWVGGHDNRVHQKINGVTGQAIPETAFPAPGGGYGGLIDGRGVLWSSGPLIAFDPSSRFDFSGAVPQVVSTNAGTRLGTNYGVGIDPNTGNVWFSAIEGAMGYWVPGAPPVLGWTNNGVQGAKGIAVDGAGNVWTAHGEGAATVGHFRTDGSFVGNVELGCTNLSPSGVAIDGHGKVWVTCRGRGVSQDTYVDGTVVRIDPRRGAAGGGGLPLGEVDLVVGLNELMPGNTNVDFQPDPYNYSDMTGFVSLGATAPSGFWDVVHEGEASNTVWGVIGWNGATPAGSGIKVEARAANDRVGLMATNNPFRAVTNGAPLSGVTGRFVEIRTTLSRNAYTSNSPVLYDLTVSPGANLVVGDAARVCQDDRVTTAENTPVLVDVLGNDQPPAGESLHLTGLSLPSFGTASLVTNAGAVSVAYTPEAGFYGADRFTYTAAGEAGIAGRALVWVSVGRASVVVLETNVFPPVAGNMTLLVNGNSPEVAVSVPAADTNQPVALPWEIVSLTQPPHGLARLKSCGVFYTPRPGWFGTDAFHYTVRNSRGLRATGTLTMEVVGAAQPIGCDSNVTAVLSLTNTAFSLLNPGNSTVYVQSWVFPGNPTKAVNFTLSGGYGAFSLYEPDGHRVDSAANFIARSTNFHTVEVEASSPTLEGVGYQLTMTCASTNLPQLAVFLGGQPVPHQGTVVYPVTEAGVSVPCELGLTNVGSTNLVIGFCYLSSGRGNFVIESPLTNSGGHVLAPGTGTNLPVRFLALEPGPANDTVVILSDDWQVAGWEVKLLAQANPEGTGAPTVRLEEPADGAIFAFPADVPLAAVASCAPTSSLWGIDFFAVSPTGHVFVGQALAGPGQSNFTGRVTWGRPAVGAHTVLAVAYDQGGLAGQSTNRAFFVSGSGVDSTNAPPVAREDTLILQGQVSNSVTYAIDVLANDTDPNGDPLTLTDFAYQGRMGHMTQEGNRLLFTLEPLWYGTNYAYYTISDGHGGRAGGWVNIYVRKAELPTVELVAPENGEYIELQTTNLSARSLELAAYAVSTNPTGAIARVSFYDQERLLGFTTNSVSNCFTFTWRMPAAGEHLLTAVALDDTGQENLSTPARIRVAGKPGNSPPMAAITNLAALRTDGLDSAVYPVVREGVIDVAGTASDSDDGEVWYQVLLQQPDGTLVADLTPNAGSNGYHLGGVTNGPLATNVDLTRYENGVYDVVLNVFDGWEVSSDTARILLDSQLKIGQFSFSVEDLSIPVAGMPLAVVRTYNSFNLGQGDFGYSWTYALKDVDLEIDEVRERTADVFGNGSAEGGFSLRVGGGRDVTLTLPDGRRTTFYFYFEGPKSCLGQGNDAYCYEGKWQAPPGVFAKLWASGGGIVYNALTKRWSNDGMTGFENFDVPGFVLETQDGTQYTIEREDEGGHFFLSGYNEDFWAHTYGTARLTQVEQRDHNKIVLGPDAIQHYDPTGQPTRALRFERDAQGRITAIYDPVSEISIPRLPVLKYFYNLQSGNLVQVQKLRDRAGGQYDLTTYEYTNAHFPHYLTGIIDPRGVPVARTEYEEDGRIKAVIDADGRTNRFYHDLSGKVEITVDRLGRTNSIAYDLRGNVTATTNALQGITLATYDDNNRKTNEVLFLDGQRYATNRWVCDTNGWVLASFDPLGHSNAFTYNGYGQVLTSVDARGHGTTNYYDAYGNLTNTVDALGHGVTNVYSTRGLLLWSRDAAGAVTENIYDDTGNLTATSLSDATRILSTNSFGDDENGNRTVSVVWFRLGAVWHGATNTQVLDAQNRVVHSIDALGFTNTTAYNEIGKVVQTIDKLGRATSFEYDRQGRPFRTTYPDWTTEVSVFDANGNRTNALDRAARPTTFVFDGLSRVTQTIFADGATTLTVYDDLGRVRFSVDAKGVTNALGYDRVGRRTSVTNALGTAQQMVVRYGFDENGNQIWSLDPRGVGTTNSFDELNRLVETRFADGTRKLTGYDAGGRRVAETNQEDIVTLFGHDGADKLLGVTNALGTTNEMKTRYGYDEVGNQTAQIDALGRTNRFEYNVLGQRVAHWLPDGTNVERFAYDAVGNLVLHTNFNGVVITNAYDAMNRLTNRSSSGGYSLSFTYTPTGQRESMTDGSGTTTYYYDLRDRLVGKVVVWAGGPEISLDYRYGANGNLTSVWSSTPNGVSLSYEHDSLNRITNVLSHGTSVAGYGYTSNGSLAAVRYASGVTNFYEYNVLNQLTNLAWRSNGAVLAGFAYELGKTGNRTNLDETVSGVTRNYAWTYDRLYRLTGETISDFGVVTYSHDAVGNRTERHSGIGGVPSTTNAYAANDWLTTDAYDSNGNTLWSTNDTVSGPFGYDVENHLTSINNGAVQFVYNGDGLRVAKRYVTTLGPAGSITNSTYYLLDDRNPTGYAQALEEHESLSSQPATLKHVFAFGLALLSQRQASGSEYFFVSDGHGSSRMLLDAQGTVVNTFAYDAFGILIASNGPPQTDYLYCGEYFDPDLGFIYLRARLDNPQTGRFLTRDTAEGRNEDPLSLHRYLYAANDPVNHSDPSGRDFGIIETLVIVGITAIIANGLTGCSPSPATARTVTVRISVASAGMPSTFNALEVQQKLESQLAAKVFNNLVAGQTLKILVVVELNSPVLGWSGKSKTQYDGRVIWRQNGPWAYSQAGVTRINEAALERRFPGRIGSQTWVNFLAHEMVWINAGGHHDPILGGGTYNEIHSGSTDVDVPFTVSPASRATLIKSFGFRER